MKSFFASAIAATFLLTACGGGGATGGSLPTVAGPPSGGAPHPTKRKVKATIRITIPKKRKHHRLRVHGHYVSPATQSIAIAITPAGGSATNYNANLTPATNPNCTASLVSPLICTVVVSLAPAEYSAAFATYDGPLSGEGGVDDAPTGNVLSSNQNASFSVVAGQANGINVSLDGVAAGIAIVPAANSSLFGNMQSGYSISKCGTASPNTEKVSVFATDAALNLIIGPGAPATTLASSDTTLIAVATPAPNAPNLYTISHPISNTAQNPATLTATATTADDAGGGTQSAHVLVQTLGGTDLCGFITEFGLPGGASTGPAGITTGPDGNLWFAESEIARIGKITTDGTITTYSAPNGYPWNIVTGPDGNLWFSDFQLGIGTSTTAGAVTYANTGLGYQQRVQGIAPDPTTGVWVTEQSGNSVDKWDGALTQYAVSDPYYGPVGIVYGPDNNFWVTLGSGHIERITPAGVATVFSGPTGAPQSITVGPDNKLWFGERGIVNAIGRMTTTGTVTNEYPLPFGTNPNAITLGPDSNVWFAEQGSGQIGKITTGGTITQYGLQSGASPQGITAGPDGNIWFTECGTGIIGRLQ